IDALAEIDLSLAKARLGEEMGAKELPQDNHEQPWLREKPDGLFLENARHPLLVKELGARSQDPGAKRLDGGEVVPATAWLGEAGESRPSKRQSDRVASPLLR